MLNRSVLVGRLTRDPELRYTPNGVAVANFNIAVNRPFSNQDAEKEADFIDCVTWRKQAENLANYMKKGNQIGVDGRLQTRRYEDKDGKMVYVTEVVADSVQFLESKGDGQQSGGQRRQQNNNAQNQSNEDPFKDSGEPIDINSDDLPF